MRNSPPLLRAAVDACGVAQVADGHDLLLHQPELGPLEPRRGCRARFVHVLVSDARRTFAPAREPALCSSWRAARARTPLGPLT